jgi:L-ascorbate metabolism protein UlaG (beta-lactamase superfamily)
MDIIWHGYSCFEIKTKGCTTVIDPYSSEIGLTLPSLKADIVLVSREHPGHNNSKGVQGEYRLIDWAGEYEIKGVAVSAQKIEPKDIAKKPVMYFTLDIGGIRICFLGDIGKGLNEELIESIGNVDILLIPVGGGEVMDAKTAHSVVEELEPRAVIPMHYGIPGLKEILETADGFMKLSGAVVEPKDKFTISERTELSPEKTEFILLNPTL